jgi:hypothetical protein
MISFAAWILLIAYLSQEDLAQARAYLTRALAIFERLGTLLEPDRIRQLLALQEGVC